MNPFLDLQGLSMQNGDPTYSKFHKISFRWNVREVSWFYWDHRLQFLVSTELCSQIKKLLSQA